MTVSKLIEILKEYPKDAEVVAEWDAMWSQIEGHNLNENVVVLDVSQWNSYKQ